ncbi:hypothetical protein GQ44DRAFT_697245 [Phaeosphaeriaceae sp. PMI808]|nr:hypothetical protein GQ44DRAFT_697245 [Phaeosphaeriaceae sp. PMI808]
MTKKDEDHKQQMETLEETYLKREQRIIEEYENKMRVDQQEKEYLKQSLSSREHIKGLTDREVVIRFKKLSTDIEEFSRVEWDPFSENSWPYSETELSALRPHNVRKLKQQIVQNSVWLALHEQVFQTPFRIIGPYGEAYDNEMYEAHNPGKPVFALRTSRFLQMQISTG